MKYVHYDKKTDEILGYYDGEIHETIPEPNLEITDERWQEAIDTGATHVNLKTNELYKKERELSLSELKELKRAEILKAFNENLQDLEGGLRVEGLNIRVDCGVSHAQNIASMITLLENTGAESIEFRLYDNTSRLTSLAELKAVQTAIIAEGFKQYEKKWALQRAIDEATTKKRVEAIKW